MITASAPGKIHLLGEHAVVYGKPALLATISLRVRVSIEPSPKKFSEHETLTEAVEAVVTQHLKEKIPPYRLQIDSELPVGSGLGSSAAVSAAYLAALLTFLKVEWTADLINDLAFQVEKVFHGNPSGGDNAAVVYGGLIYYRKEFDFLRSISPLPFKPHKNIKSFGLIYSGKPYETTKVLVEKVAQNARKFQKVFDHQEQITKNMVIALQDGNEALLLSSIYQGEANLEKIGVVGKKAKSIIRQVEKIGGAAKIMGGGGVKEGSGMLLCYHPDPKKVAALAKEQGWDYKVAQLEEKGVTRDE